MARMKRGLGKLVGVCPEEYNPEGPVEGNDPLQSGIPVREKMQINGAITKADIDDGPWYERTNQDVGSSF